MGEETHAIKKRKKQKGRKREHQRDDALWLSAKASNCRQSESSKKVWCPNSKDKE